MTQPAMQGPAPSSRVEHRISVPSHVPMVSLLGTGDEVLRAIEDAFPALDFHVRGNEITVSGPTGEVSLAEQLLDALAEVAVRGTPLTADVVER
ncbi:MAG: PhoH family protein, partial [Actinomycetales bacterium]|nr:PhoH family protein [Actinomycetales bacterium]